jgi:crotonobetaine/carnitine-CoA ligase
VTNSLGVILPFVFAQPPTPRDATHHLRRILAAPTPYGILEEFKQRFGVQQFAEGFGQTEICMPIATPLALKLDRPKGAAGLLIEQFFDVRLVDSDTDEEVPTGEVGELIIRHKTPWTINVGYVGMPEKAAEAWRNLWFHTGDALRRDAQGWYYFVDRLKDALRRRGENISSAEVEAPIREHPAVADVAIVAVPADMEGGEDEVKACIVLNPDRSVTFAALMEWCEERLPAFAVPRYIEFMDSLPKTPTEKIRKGVLRAAGVTAETWDRVKAGYQSRDGVARRSR